MTLDEQWDSFDCDVLDLGDLLGMVVPTSKFAWVGGLRWNVNNVKFSFLVKFAFQQLFACAIG